MLSIGRFIIMLEYRVRTVLSETHQGGPLVCKLQCPLGLWQPEGGDARLSLPCLRTGDGS